MKDAYYFAHDANAFSDPKIIKLRAAFGLEGYGFYWALLEMMRSEDTYKINVVDLDLLAFYLNTDETKVKQILNKTITIGLFVEKHGKLYSPSLLRRMEKFKRIQEARSRAGQKSRKNPKSGNKAETNEEQNENKSGTVKESKEENSKEENSKEEQETMYECPDEKSEPQKQKNNLNFDYRLGCFTDEVPEVWLQSWIEAFPAVNILGEIKKAEAWLFANPKNRKSDHKRYLHNWLSKEQDRAPRQGGGGRW